MLAFDYEHEAAADPTGHLSTADAGVTVVGCGPIALRSAGASVAQGRGSRVRVSLNGHDAVFHAPHPERVAAQGRIRAAREFLEKAGIQP